MAADRWFDMRTTRGRLRRSAFAAVAAVLCAAALAGPAGPAHAAGARVAGVADDDGTYHALIVRTTYGIPHITATSFGSLGFGYGYALASDNICTMANDYVTVEGQRSLYFGPDASYPSSFSGGTINNLDSDIFWQSIIGQHVIGKLLAVRSGPGAIGSQLRSLFAGYVAGYNDYLASVGGSAGVADPSCRGQGWVKPITLLDAYLRAYQIVGLASQGSFIDAIAQAQPPAASAHAAATPRWLRAVARFKPGTHGLPTAARLWEAARRYRAGAAGGLGSNAIAVGSAGTMDHASGLLLGNPHFPWNGEERFYQVQLTIPGMMNVEGATLFGLPLVAIGFTSGMAWSHTVATAFEFTPYQLTLVPGDPTSYLLDGQPEAMTSQTVTVQAKQNGVVTPVQHTVWYSRWGPIFNNLSGIPLPWSTQVAFALADANAQNFRYLNHFLATDEAQSVAQELSALRQYEGIPYVNTIAADSGGHALYADIGSIPHVTDAQAQACDTGLGSVTFAALGLPILDGSQSTCAWGTDPDSVVPGIFGPSEEPSLQRQDFVENSNGSFWMTNPAQPLTGFPRIIGLTDTPLSLRTRSALTMVTGRVSGTDGLGPAGFTFQDMKNLMFSDIQYGASLVLPQLVSMCESFPGGLAPTSPGGTIRVGDACSVLAGWNGREDVNSVGPVLFRDFWERALALPEGPFSVPFDPANPVSTPSGLDTADPSVQQAFGDALADLTASGLPYNVALGTVQYVVRNGTTIPLPGGPGDPDGEFNAIYQDVVHQPGADPAIGSSYIQVVNWPSGAGCPQASTLVTYSESASPQSPYYADQTLLFSQKQWATAAFCPGQILASRISVTVVRGP